MRTLFTLSLFLILSISLVAQDDFRPGYIITLQKDTVTGFVNYTLKKIKGGNCEFKPEKSSEMQVFTPEKILGFGYFAEDKYYETYAIHDRGVTKKVFAELLIRGKANLYLFDEYFYIQKDTAASKIEKTQLKESGISKGIYIHKTYIATLNRYLYDCLPGKLLKGDVMYTQKDFVEVLKNYSECAKAEYYIYKRSLQLLKWKYNILAGFNRSRLSYNNPEMDFFEPDNYFFAGAGVEISSPRINDKISLSIEVTYNHNTYKGQSEAYGYPRPIVKDYTIELVSIKVPVAIKVNFKNENSTPYLKAGATPLIPVKGTWVVKNQSTTEINHDLNEKDAFILMGGVGFQQKITSRMGFFFEFRMEKYIHYIEFYSPVYRSLYAQSQVLNKMIVIGIKY